MKEIKILCVYDGYITKDIMSGMKELEKFGAHITMINDDQIKNVGDVTNRMLLLEQKRYCGGTNVQSFAGELFRQRDFGCSLYINQQRDSGGLFKTSGSGCSSRRR